MLATACVLGACSNMKLSDFQHTEPTLKLEEYFPGKSRAWGIFEDRFGTVRRQFTVDIEGSWDGEVLTLVEDFVYSDGETDQRIWKIRKTGPDTYAGTADDVIGTARGQVAGNALNWSYDFLLPLNGNTLTVRLDDWMFLQDDKTLINKAEMSKWGITLGRLFITFRKMGEANGGSASNVSRLAAE